MSRRHPRNRMEPEPLDDDPAYDAPPRPDDYSRCWPRSVALTGST